jgi:hypothetical protein
LAPVVDEPVGEVPVLRLPVLVGDVPVFGFAAAGDAPVDVPAAPGAELPAGVGVAVGVGGVGNSVIGFGGSGKGLERIPVTNSLRPASDFFRSL